MLKKLQKKFILLTTIISIIVMTFIAIAINIINYSSIMSYSDEVLNILVTGELNFSSGNGPYTRIPKEFAFTTRFFVVRSNENNEFDYIDTKNISSIYPDDPILYAENENPIGQTSGRIEDFKFIKTPNKIGHTYIFLDIEEDLIGFENYMFYSIFIVICAVVLIFILSCVFSKKAVSPIAESYERQKRFITDVSHEFKTPLAIISADCDVIEIDNGEGEWTRSIKSQILRLSTLVENLISLTRLDEEKSIMQKADFSLSDAVSDTLNEFTAAIKKAGLEFSCEISKNITYNGDEIFIRKLLGILTENAIKYSRGYIKATLMAEGGKKIFAIENSCEAVEIGKHNSWFERFYRADKSRNSQTKGFGIGLSVAKSICDKHGAKISAHSKTGQEIIVSIVF